MNAKQGRGVYAVAFILFMLGLSWLIFLGLKEGSAYLLNVSEALAKVNGEFPKARILGIVSEKNLDLDFINLNVKFVLQDKDDHSQSMLVEYSGALPEIFQPGAEVIVEGRLNPDTGIFGAVMLITKCPSKYEKQNRF